MHIPALATSFSMPVSTVRETGRYGVPGGLPDKLDTAYDERKLVHLGVDLGGVSGTPILAAANGKVVAASTNNPSFGKSVIIEHSLTDGTKVYTLYGHMSSLNVSVGQLVYMGDKVGGMGGSAGTDPKAFPVHLHFEVSTKNLFFGGAADGQYSGGYDTPEQFTTTKLFTLDPMAYVKARPITNVQNGTGNADFLWGVSSSERMDGRGGNDEIRGNSGNDTITGGAGTDSLWGGIGNDVFDFNIKRESVVGSLTRDKINDFSPGLDKIDLSTIDANELVFGNQTFRYIGTAAFSVLPNGFSAGQLSMVGGILRGDVNGDGRADFEIQVLGSNSSINTLAATDFFL